jgi:hypothetical protein
MQGALKIGRLRADCRVIGPPEASPAVGDRATRALRDHLPRALRSGFARRLDCDDESVWIVRRLDLSIMTAADTPADDLAAVIATSLGHALADALTGDGDGVNTIRFPRRAAYLAQFVVDVASGDAWSRWYCAPLAGWKLLSPSATIRAALAQNPEQGHAALASLDDGALARVVNALAPLDERTMLDLFASLTPADVSSEEAVFRSALAGCSRAVGAGPSRGGALFAFMRSEAAPSRTLLHDVDVIMDTVAAARAGGTVSRAALRQSIESALAAQRPGVQAHAAGIVTPLVDLLLAEAAAKRAGSVASASEGPLFTRFGGVSLLLRDVDALPWSAWTAGWPSPSAGTASACMKWLTIALCAGRAQSADVLDDVAWRALLGIPADLTTRDVARWLREVGAGRCRVLARDMPPSVLTQPEHAWLRFPRRVGIGASWCQALARIARAVLRGFAHRLPGFADSTADYLWRNFLAFDATIELEDERVVVQCGRPPLHLVLTITGMTRGLVTGLDSLGRPILVFSRA